MGRRKQWVRKPTGGKAPKKQLVSSISGANKHLADLWKLPKAERDEGIELLNEIYSNILQNPSNSKFHDINLNKIRAKLDKCLPAFYLLFSAGFTKRENGQRLQWTNTWVTFHKLQQTNAALLQMRIRNYNDACDYIQKKNSKIKNHIKNKINKNKNSKQATETIKINEMKKQKLLAQKREKLKAKLQSQILQNRVIIIKGCGNGRCMNPYCKSNLDNKNKQHSTTETSKLALKMITTKHKNCTSFKQRPIANGAGIWMWNDNGQWAGFDAITSKHIDDNIRNGWFYSNKCEISFPLTKGPYFSQSKNKGIYCCYVQFDELRNKIKSVVQKNTKTQFVREMNRTVAFDFVDKQFEKNHTFVPNMTHKQAKCLQFGDVIDIRCGNGWSYKAKIHGIEIKENDEKTNVLQTFIKIHLEGHDTKLDEWICIDKMFNNQLNRLQKYKSVSGRRGHRFPHLKIGDFIDANPIYIDPGWKPAKILQFDEHSGQIQVRFKHSILKNCQSCWIHLDNEIECAEFMKGRMDKMQVKALFFATISAEKYKIIEVKNIANKDSVNVYESLLKTKCKNFQQKCDIEKYLWHGTGSGSSDTLKLIITNGFDRSYNKVGKYGKGTYFSTTASYSVRYGYCGKDKNNSDIYFILLCRVIVGEYMNGNENMKQIAKKPDGTEYDSLVNDKENPSIFVSWRDFMAIPVYLVKFQSATG